MVIRIFHTLLHLKPIQIYYRVYFKLLKKPVIVFYRTRWRKFPHRGQQLIISPFPQSRESTDGKEFVFLNQPKTFHHHVNWDYSLYGKLWTYKLNYFHYIHSSGCSSQIAEKLIENYCSSLSEITVGLEPYPISLRTINWIKYFINNSSSMAGWDKALYAQLKILYWLVEYHLLGNHLIENGFALLFGAYYFRDEEFYRKASKILRAELPRQILHDGGHFERSPMYHTIILEHVLDCYNLVSNNAWKKDTLKDQLRDKARSMLGWLQTIIFQNGDLPQVNDTVSKEYFSMSVLASYAKQMGIEAAISPLKESGYRMIRQAQFELFLDVGDVGPDYIPGHAHSDTFSFILYSHKKPLIVERGTSTYLPGPLRTSERSTASHNTVMINNEEQTDVWATFRVGRRAKIVHLVENQNDITATHNGYRHRALFHTRTWKWTNEQVVIIDKVSGNTIGVQSTAFLHFHPDTIVTIEKGDLILAGGTKIKILGQQSVEIEDYDYALGFNKTAKGQVLKIHFENQLTVVIDFKFAGSEKDLKLS